MVWANFLHFYQPPTQKPFWVHKVAKEAYRPILEGLLKIPEAKVTLNINGVLLDLFEENSEADIIDLLRELLHRGQIELTGSAKFHPLLPFLPEEERVRQIRLNEETLQKHFQGLWTPRGFFPPEMGFDNSLIETVRKLGYHWIIIDELSFPKEKRPIDYSKIYQNSGVDLFFRERKMSWLILSGQIGTGKLLFDSLGERLRRNEYLLTAMDGETFGHHRPGLENLLFEAYQSSKMKSVLISDLKDRFSEIELSNPEPSTWALMEKDLEEKKPFSRWFDKENEIQVLQWELTELAISSIKNLGDSEKSRQLLDRALHSDQYWWASARPWWSIEMIERGAKEFLTAIEKIPQTAFNTRTRAKELYWRIIETAFDWQRSGKVDQLSQKEDEDVRQRTDTGLPSLPKSEIEKMVKKLNQELKIVVKNQEYERAAQIRDRISELKRYENNKTDTAFLKEGDREWK